MKRDPRISDSATCYGCGLFYFLPARYATQEECVLCPRCRPENPVEVYDARGLPRVFTPYRTMRRV